MVVMLSGIDNANLRTITSVKLINPENGSEIKSLPLESSSPRRNVVIPLSESQINNFDVVIEGIDKDGEFLIYYNIVIERLDWITK